MPAPIVAGAFWAGAMVVGRTLLGWVLRNGGSILANIAATLGIYFIVAKPASSALMSFITNSFSGAPELVVDTLMYLDVDNYLTAVASALAARKTMDAGTLMLAKKP